MHSIFICVPAFGQTITAATFLTVCQLQGWLASKGIQGGVSTLSFPDIAELRNMFTTIWYDSMPQCTHILHVDSDMGFSPDLVTDMLMFDKPIIGTIYPQRKVPRSWAGSGTGEVNAERNGNFMRVEGVGMGCTLIRRDAVARMIEAFPELIDTRLTLHPAKPTLENAGCRRLLRFFDKIDDPHRGNISEDLSFCIRGNQVGIPTWASIGHKVSHVGNYDYGGTSYLEEQLQQQIAQAQAQRQINGQPAVSIPNPMTPLPPPAYQPMPPPAIAPMPSPMS